MRRPYVWVCDDDHTMHMVGHNDPGVDFHLWEMDRDFLPKPIRQVPNIVQPHLAVHNVAEQTGPVAGTQGHEICTLSGVIEAGKTGGLAPARDS